MRNVRTLLIVLAGIASLALLSACGSANGADSISGAGKIVVMGGTEPAHSTDAVSAILAEYVQADLLVNLTAVDGLYTKDPKKYDDAELIEEITASDMMGIISGNDVKAGTYEFIDTTAIQMIKRSNLETVIANGNEPQNLIKAIKGEKIGTRVIIE